MMFVAALLSWFLVGLFIRVSRARGWGQPIRAEGPESHLKKVGTPTAGGVPFTAALAVVFFGLYFTHRVTDPRELLIMLTALGMGIIGGIDDLLKVRWQMNGGKTKKELLAREKFPLQLLVALVFAWFAAPLAAHELVPGLGGFAGVPVWDILLLTVVMLGSVNAFNFTDGIDGLLAGVGVIVLLPLLGSVLWFALGREYPEGGIRLGRPARRDAAPAAPVATAPPADMRSTEQQIADLDREIEEWRLRQEIDSLKRHSSDQEALTIRLSNSLTRAETDAARAKQALKMAESRLEDESRRRVEAERAADEEARLRRMAEERLRSYQTRYGLAAL